MLGNDVLSVLVADKCVECVVLEICVLLFARFSMCGFVIYIVGVL